MSRLTGSFTFIHAADLHLGSPLTGLAIKDDHIARRFSEASRKAFSELITRAIDLAVAFVVIAGDVYDGDWKDNTIGLYFNREIARLHRAGIALFLLKGNHDAESVITKTIALPETVQRPVRRLGQVSFRPRLGVPRAIRKAFIAPAVTGFATFSLVGFSVVFTLLLEDLTWLHHLTLFK